MTHTDKDILKENGLKSFPYEIPEGYIETFKAKAMGYTVPQIAAVSPWERLKPLVAIAATFIIMVTAGTFFLSKVTPQETYTQEDYMVFSREISDDMLHEAFAEAEIQEDDIIEYLIYSGESAETIESYRQYQ